MRRGRWMSFAVILLAGSLFCAGCSFSGYDSTGTGDQEGSAEQEETGKEEKSIGTEFDEGRVGFYTNGYWGMNIRSIDNETKTIIYDGYEGAENLATWNQTGTIVDADTLDIYGVTVHFDEDSFTLENGEDALIMSSMVGSDHMTDRGAGKYVKQAMVPAYASTADGICATVDLYEGEYDDDRLYGEADCPDNFCRVVISNVTETSFDFRIEQYDPASGNYGQIFKDHTAEFTGSGDTAAFYGEQYTLEFTFPSEVSVRISGFAPVEGVTFCNDSIPGHGFS